MFSHPLPVLKPRLNYPYLDTILAYFLRRLSLLNTNTQSRQVRGNNTRIITRLLWMVFVVEIPELLHQAKVNEEFALLSSTSSLSLSCSLFICLPNAVAFLHLCRANCRPKTKKKIVDAPRCCNSSRYYPSFIRLTPTRTQAPLPLERNDGTQQQQNKEEPTQS